MAVGKEYIGGCIKSATPTNIENELLKIYSSSNPQAKIDKILKGDPSWPMLYHLSPSRGFILDWYSFKSGASVLEVGAECGAVTEVLANNKDINLTALEPNKKHASVIAKRLRQSKNLQIITTDIYSYKPKDKFDYIVCVGSFERMSILLSKPEDAYNKLFITLASLLKPEGKLLRYGREHYRLLVCAHMEQLCVATQLY